MQGTEEGALLKSSNLIFMRTLLSYHHSFLTKVLQHEAMCQSHLGLFDYKKKKKAPSPCKIASDDKTQALHFISITNYINK